MKKRHKEYLNKTGTKYRGSTYRYSIPENINYLIRISHKYDKSFLLLLILYLPFNSLLEMVWSFFNKYIVNYALGIGERKELLAIMAAILLTGLIATIIVGLLETRVWYTKSRRLNYCFERALSEKQMDTDYENLEKVKTKTLFTQAGEAVGYFSQTYERVIAVLINIVKLIGWSALIVTLSPVLILIILLPTFGFYLAIKRNITWFQKHKKEWLPLERKMQYIRIKSEDFTAAKDIRLYSMESWFRNMYNHFMEKRLWWYKQQGYSEAKNNIIVLAIVLFRDAASYGFITYQLVKGSMTPGDFMLYISSVSELAYAFYNFLDNVNNLKWLSVYISWYREFLELPDNSNRGRGHKLPERTFDITFDHVSYKYSGAEKETLKDLSFTIKTGEKIAVVGNNGAGKTTLVKLICGIYSPTKGKILIDGIPVSEYSRDELFRMFSAVFQDIHIMPSSIAENVTMGVAYDEDAFNYAIKHSGISDKLNVLPEHENTNMVRTVFDDAIDLSGGEMQKLALARALYKQKTENSKILLLDEPTAALDPIAERNMYLEYLDFTKDKTAVFISHRLASTRFCNRIFLLSGGEIAECGTHEELIAAGGEYAKIFAVQSGYYREEADENGEIE